MDPPEPIHGVIGVDRALGLRVTVRELPLMSCWEATIHTPQILQKNIQLNLDVKFLFFLKPEKAGRAILIFFFQISVIYPSSLVCSKDKCQVFFFLFVSKKESTFWRTNITLNY